MTAFGPAWGEMARYDNSYSRLVAGLKIVLPLLALAILSTLFLVARTVDPAQNIPYADVDIEEIAREQRIGQPNYAAVTEDGAAISVTAAEARPDPDSAERITGSDIVAGIDLKGGGRVDIRAERLVLDTAREEARLSGGVEVKSSNGYTMQTEGLTMALDATRVTSDSAVRATAPATTLTADQFELTGRGNEAAPYLLVFKGHVKLVYDGNS